MAANLPNLVDRLSALSVTEAAELSHMLEEKWGVSAARPTGPLPGTPAPDAIVAEPVQTEFIVTLTGVGESKVSVVKEVRTITGLDLKSAMALANEIPKVIKEGVTRAEADALRTKIEAAGGTVSIT